MEPPHRYVYAPLAERKIILGVTSSSAIYRAIDLSRELIRMGAEVKVFMTEKAMEFVSPILFSWATGSDPVVELTGKAEHIRYGKEYDAMIIAPCTINTLSKIAHGIGDNPVTLTAITFLGLRKKLIIVPAMNINLYKSPQYARAESILKEYGAIIIKPFIIEDKAKFPPISDLARIIDAAINRGRDLEGINVLITAGPTREYIDPVRVITNPSSGLMGVLLALEFYGRGANVTLIHGPLTVKPPYVTRNIEVETTEDMAKAVHDLSSKVDYDVMIFAGAPADYAPVRMFKEKIPSRKGEITLLLKPSPKVIKNIVRKPRVLVGFAAETVGSLDELVEKAREKLYDYNADLIVGNIVGRKDEGFGKEFLHACLVWSDGFECLGTIHKAYLARKIADWVVKRLGH